MMANRADKDRVKADLAGPDYPKAIELIRDRIAGKKNRLSTIQGEISGVWNEIEKMGVNKAGAKVFLRLDGLEEQERNDQIRTIMKMAELAGWTKGDMIDAASGNVVEFPAPAPTPSAAKPKGGGKAKTAAETPAVPPPAGDSDLNPSDVLDRADYIQVMADHFEEGSTLEAAQAHKLAVDLWNDLPNRDRDAPRTRENAIANAEREMETWPE